jgi:hypothetical protein
VPLNAKILDETLGGHTMVVCGQVDDAHFAKMESALKAKNVMIRKIVANFQKFLDEFETLLTTNEILCTKNICL